MSLYDYIASLSVPFQIEGVGEEVMTTLITGGVILLICLTLKLAWSITTRAPLNYEVYVVEMHTFVQRRFVSILQIGHEYFPRNSWSELLDTMREQTEERRAARGDERSTGDQLVAISDTNVLIQAPSTLQRGSDRTVDTSNSLLLSEVNVVSSENISPNSQRDSQFAASAAIALISRADDGQFQFNNSHNVRSPNGTETVVRYGNLVQGHDTIRVFMHSHSSSEPVTPEGNVSLDVNVTGNTEVTSDSVRQVTVGVSTSLLEDEEQHANSSTASIYFTNDEQRSSDDAMFRDEFHSENNHVHTEDSIDNDAAETSVTRIEPSESLSVQMTTQEVSVPIQRVTPNNAMISATEPDVEDIQNASSANEVDCTEQEPSNSKKNETDAVEIEANSEEGAPIRLKFLDDRLLDARFLPTTTVLDFKSKYFASSFQQGLVVRLIYQGQLMRDDNRTLVSYGVCEGSVVHCHVSKTPYQQTPSTPAGSTSTADGSTSAAAPQPHLRRTRRFSPARQAAAQEDRQPDMWLARLFISLLSWNITGFWLPPFAFVYRTWAVVVRWVIERIPQPSHGEAFYQRWYRGLYEWSFGDYGREPDYVAQAADAARRPRRESYCIGDFLLWIFAFQFVSVWGFVYCFPQVCDRTALALLALLTLYFFFVVCRTWNNAPIGQQDLEHQAQEQTTH